MAKQQHREKPAEYRMPHVEWGDVVNWHDGPGAPATAVALVSSVGNDSVSLAILVPSAHNFLIKEGVRHFDHPDQDLVRNTDSGCWSYRQGWAELQARLTRLEEILKQLNG